MDGGRWRKYFLLHHIYSISCKKYQTRITKKYSYSKHLYLFHIYIKDLFDLHIYFRSMYVSKNILLHACIRRVSTALTTYQEFYSALGGLVNKTWYCMYYDLVTRLLVQKLMLISQNMWPHSLGTYEISIYRKELKKGKLFFFFLINLFICSLFLSLHT